MDTIREAFGSQHGIYSRILSAIDERPSDRTLFDDIAKYHLDSITLHSHSNANPHFQSTSSPNGQDDPEPASKKRKLPNGTVLPINSIATATSAGKRETVLLAPEISFSIPQRKKMAAGVYHYPTTNTYTIGAKSVASADEGELEFEVPLSKIETALKLPVPEKVGRSWNYIFLGTEIGIDAVVFTMNEPTGKGKEQEYILGSSMPQTLRQHDRTDKQKNLLEVALEIAGANLTVPDENEFASATPEAHRKNEKSFHVKAFRGSKDGFLFFLSTGIFFGFKKPLFFVGLEEIESLSYTSILQRTFNMVISYREGEEEKEVEFSMLDQADYGGINGYVGRHGLNDASLAAGRRAKMVGKQKKGEGNGVLEGGEGEDDDDGRTELEKAEAQLQDEEDEMEEDFELGSSDDGDDSGEESDGDGDFDGEGGNLVKEELGSQAEDVSDDDDDVEVVGDEKEGIELEEADEEDEEDQEVVVEEDQEVVVEEAPQPLPVKTQVFQPRKAGEPDPEDEDQL